MMDKMYLVLVLFLLAVVVALVYHLRRRGAMISKASGEAANKAASHFITVKDADVIAKGMERFIEVMIGLYEPMYQVSTGNLISKVDVFGEWCQRVENKESNTDYSSLIQRISEASGSWTDEEFIYCAKRIIKAADSVGIVRDDASHIIYDQAAALKYGTLDGRQPCYGESVKVLKPCWYYDNIILDKGILI